jgi:hypothetical protein
MSMSDKIKISYPYMPPTNAAVNGIWCVASPNALYYTKSLDTSRLIDGPAYLSSRPLVRIKLAISSHGFHVAAMFRYQPLQECHFTLGGESRNDCTGKV